MPLPPLQMNASDRGLMTAFRDIGNMAEKLNLPRSIVVGLILARVLGTHVGVPRWTHSFDSDLICAVLCPAWVLNQKV